MKEVVGFDLTTLGAQLRQTSARAHTYIYGDKLKPWQPNFIFEIQTLYLLIHQSVFIRPNGFVSFPRRHDTTLKNGIVLGQRIKMPERLRKDWWVDEGYFWVFLKKV